MNLAQPIKKVRDLENFKDYYKKIKPNYRNELLIILGLNTALRISDILSLKWESVYNFEKEEYRNHIFLIEQKTGKGKRNIVHFVERKIMLRIPLRRVECV